MSTDAKRVIAFILNLVTFVLLVAASYKTLTVPGFFNWEFLAFMVAAVAHDQVVRWDERLKHGID